MNILRFFCIKQRELVKLNNEINSLKNLIEVNNDIYIQNLSLMEDKISMLEDKNRNLLIKLEFLNLINLDSKKNRLIKS